MDNNEIFAILDRHKKDLTCDICRKRFWFWQKCVRCVIRTKENIWTEYYHILCLEKKGMLRRLNKLKAGRWDNKDDKDQPSTNVVH